MNAFWINRFKLIKCIQQLLITYLFIGKPPSAHTHTQTHTHTTTELQFCNFKIWGTVDWLIYMYVMTPDKMHAWNIANKAYNINQDQFSNWLFKANIKAMKAYQKVFDWSRFLELISWFVWTHIHHSHEYYGKNPESGIWCLRYFLLVIFP